MTESYSKLWQKTKLALDYNYENYLNDSDYFIKADDDAYAVMENLKQCLSDKPKNEPIYYGAKYWPFGGFNCGGCRYVMNRHILKTVVRLGIRGRICDNSSIGAADLKLGECLRYLNISAGNTTDEEDKLIFIPFRLQTHR